MTPDRSELAPLVDAGMSDQEIADRLGVSARTVLRWRKRLDLASRWTPATSPHGTLHRYRRLGCTCTACRAANAAARAKHADRLTRATAATAYRAFEPWTPAEDAVALAHTPLDASRLLGRSWSACCNRRTLLRRRARQEVPAAA